MKKKLPAGYFFYFLNKKKSGKFYWFIFFFYAICPHGLLTFSARKHFFVTDSTKHVYLLLLFSLKASEDSVQTFSFINATSSKER